MKILYSAFECNPNIGSDAYVGWSWAVHMSELNEVHVLTNELNKKDIEEYKINNPVKAIFHYVPVPRFLEKVLKGRKFYFVSYVLWQKKAFQIARKLNEIVQFDIVHHVSIADFRVVGQLWKMNVPFVYGPVGGGQETPKSLDYYVRNYRKSENVRKYINKIAISLPGYKQALRKAAVVYVSNDETIEFMKKSLGHDVKLNQMCELGVDRRYLLEREGITHKKNDVIRILISGRLMYRKGIEMLLDVIPHIKSDVSFIVDLYGGGHEINKVKQQVIDMNLQNIVIVHGKVPFDEMPKLYEESDIVALPSLRETTGTAVIEAMANKLPIVALNQNGVKYLVEHDAGILVDIGSREQTVQSFAEALSTLINNYDLRIQMGNRGFEKILNQYTWDKKVVWMSEMYNSVK